jgi:hypothetical protein
MMIIIVQLSFSNSVILSAASYSILSYMNAINLTYSHISLYSLDESISLSSSVNYPHNNQTYLLLLIILSILISYIHSINLFSSFHYNLISSYQNNLIVELFF